MIAQPAFTVAMEVCGRAHHWARTLAGMGHAPLLIAPRYVKAFVKRHKNDSADAEAIVEAALRPTMRFVEPKTAEQQGRAVLFRTRTQFIYQRTEADDLVFGEPAALRLWSFRLGQCLAQTGLGRGGKVTAAAPTMPAEVCAQGNAPHATPGAPPGVWRHRAACCIHRHTQCYVVEAGCRPGAVGRRTTVDGASRTLTASSVTFYRHSRFGLASARRHTAP